MTSHPIFETAVSLILIFALLSILVSSLMEFWNHYKQARAKLLKEAIHQLLRDPLNKHYGELLMEHFLIKNLTNHTTQRPPQYISAHLFAEALIDVIAQQARHRLVRLKLPKAGARGIPEVAIPDSYASTDEVSKDVFNRFKIGLESMQPSPLRDALFSMYDKSSEDPTLLKKRLEQWYNDYMETVSGWFKARQFRKSVFFGFLVALLFNVDSLHVFKVLSMDTQLRANLTAVAEDVAIDYQALADSSRSDQAALWGLLRSNAPDSSARDSLFSRLQVQDSLAGSALAKADSVLGIVHSLNVPIGWSKDTAPLSWLKKRRKPQTEPQEFSATSSDGLIAYNIKRNHTVRIWYFMGICISGFALSMGAPFWFDVLVKLVNLRIAGKKPEGNPKV